jgi:hypothetical protein
MQAWPSVVGLAAFVTLGAQPVFNLGPPLPYEDSGACPFECCTYREWAVQAETTVRSARDDAAPVAFRVRPGQRVTGVTGVVVTTKLGRAVVSGPRSSASADRLWSRAKPSTSSTTLAKATGSSGFGGRWTKANCLTAAINAKAARVRFG